MELVGLFFELLETGWKKRCLSRPSHTKVGSPKPGVKTSLVRSEQASLCSGYWIAWIPLAAPRRSQEHLAFDRLGPKLVITQSNFSLCLTPHLHNAESLAEGLASRGHHAPQFASAAQHFLGRLLTSDSATTGSVEKLRWKNFEHAPRWASESWKQSLQVFLAGIRS